MPEIVRRLDRRRQRAPSTPGEGNNDSIIEDLPGESRDIPRPQCELSDFCRLQDNPIIGVRSVDDVCGSIGFRVLLLPPALRKPVEFSTPDIRTPVWILRS